MILEGKKISISRTYLHVPSLTFSLKDNCCVLLGEAPEGVEKKILSLWTLPLAAAASASPGFLLLWL